MDDYLTASLAVLVAMLVFCNPVTVVTVTYLCRRTGKYLMPSLAGVLVNVVSLTLCVLGFGWLSGEFPSNLLEAAGLEVAGLVLLTSLLHGLLLVGVVLLVIRERRLKQAIPSKLAMAVFVACLAAWAFFEFSPTDDQDSKLGDLSDKLMTAYVSAIQGKSTEFQGHTIHLGDDYIYLGSRDSLLIQKLGPGFGQLDEDFYLWYEPVVKDMEQVLTYWCGLEDYSCEHGERDNYRLVSQTHFFSDEDEGYTTTIYYSPECDVQLEHSGKDPEGRYAEFVETFFSESCS